MQPGHPPTHPEVHTRICEGEGGGTVQRRLQEDTTSTIGTATHSSGGWSPKASCVSKRAALLPKGAQAAAEFEFCILHLLNIRRYPAEKVQ